MRFLLTHFFTFFLLNIFAISMCNASNFLPSDSCLKSISNQQKKNHISSIISIEYTSHSTFKITSPQGVNIVVDYTGVEADKPPNIITLNHTKKDKLIKSPNSKTKIIIEAWSSKTNTPHQHVVLKDDVAIRNFQTNIYQDGILKTSKGNSIFIFKIAELCIAHLGNIQHGLSNAETMQIGNIDIVMVPVDGRDNFTTQQLAKLVTNLNATIIIPMHWKRDETKQDFMADMSAYFSIAGYPTNAISVSTKTLPKTPTIVTMIPKYDQTEAEFNKYH